MENKHCIHNRKNSCIAHKNADPNLVSHPSELLFDTSMSFHLAGVEHPWIWPSDV